MKKLFKIRYFPILSSLMVLISLNSYCQHIVLSSYFGGNKNDWIDDLCIDNEGDILVTGTTFSNDFPVTGSKISNIGVTGGTDVFVAKFSKTGELLFSILIGGNGYDGNSQIELDHSGNIIITGVTLSTDLPTSNNAYDSTYNGDLDVFAAKLNASGDSILFMSYLGGNGQDHHPKLDIDIHNNIYITGPTRSANFPTTKNAYDSVYNGTVAEGYYGDIFISKFDSLGERLLYSSFLGGNSEETVSGIDVNENGIAYLTGATVSSDFPVTKRIVGSDYIQSNLEVTDAFIMAIDCQYSTIRFSTIFGGNGDDAGSAVIVDKEDCATVAGNTSSVNFPTTKGCYNEIYHQGDSLSKGEDIFISKFDALGNKLVFSTYLGSKGDEGWCDLSVDKKGNMIIGGGTSATDFPIMSKAIDSTFNDGDNQFVYRDAFISKLSNTADELVYSTYFGGNGDDNVFKVETDNEGLIYVGGLTTSSDLPTTDNSYDKHYNGGRDAFLLILDPNK